MPTLAPARPTIAAIAPRIRRVLMRAWVEGSGSQVSAVELMDGDHALLVDGVLRGERYGDRQAAMQAAARFAWG